MESESKREIIEGIGKKGEVIERVLFILTINTAFGVLQFDLVY
jgi:hypothetical protein